MEDSKIKRLSVNLEEDIIKIAEEKAKLLFKGNMDNYINWLICSNNKIHVKNLLWKKEREREEVKPTILEGTEKTAMYNNICDFCKKGIYQGDEICKAEGYQNYIHKKCCKNKAL